MGDEVLRHSLVQAPYDNDQDEEEDCRPGLKLSIRRNGVSGRVGSADVMSQERIVWPSARNETARTEALLLDGSIMVDENHFGGLAGVNTAREA